MVSPNELKKDKRLVCPVDRRFLRRLAYPITTRLRSGASTWFPPEL